ncbi:MAG: sigma-54-dependent Fis family transcriptional regulator, partial [Pseudomonadales bacterium]|nr:sigma-54-dependent Fis family transcriptional regulator [Pseudomonadales bacterium]
MGISTAFQNFQAPDVLCQQLRGLAALDLSLLLTGESGTGKTYYARRIHEASQRADKPYLELNCAAIPETLLESELFGAVRGAHSGATGALPGKIAAAEGGTLFLDEIGLISPVIQGKLLQFLNSGEYFQLGSPRLSRSNVRIICATNADLEQQAAAGTFRSDLLYRINGYTLELPPLRAMGSELPGIAQYFLEQARLTHQLECRPLSSAAITSILRHHWPGNFRELKHTMEAAAVNAHLEQTDWIEVRHLRLTVSGRTVSGNKVTGSLKQATLQFQRQYIEDCLHQESGNVSRTAKRLDLSRSHLHSLMKSLGIDRDVTIAAEVIHLR